MKIKIYKKSLSENCIIYMNDKKREFVLYNAIETTFDVERFKFKVFDMISDWPKQLIDPNISDGVDYKIVIKDIGKETVYHFKNKFPEDIYLIEDLVEQVGLEIKNG